METEAPLFASESPFEIRIRQGFDFYCNIWKNMGWLFKLKVFDKVSHKKLSRELNILGWEVRLEAEEMAILFLLLACEVVQLDTFEICALLNEGITSWQWYKII